MIALALPDILPVGTLLLYFVLAWLLLWRLARTGERTFAWLIVALVIWPSLLWAFNATATRVFRNPEQIAHIFPFSLASGLGMTTGLMVEIVGDGHRFVGSALLVVAVWSLSRGRIQSRVRQTT